MCEEIKFYFLKAKGQNGNFLVYDVLLQEGLQRLEKLKVMYLVVLNVNPHSPVDASWGIRV